jgi:uncharacterized protein involved in exopolysaccharide biosynthesis
MEQQSLASALRSRWWVPALVTAAALVASGVIAVRSPRYQATASVVAQAPANSDVQALGFTDVATTSTVASRALRDTGIRESVTDLQGQITVVASRSTMYQVSVTNSVPDTAVALANAVARESALLYQQLAGGTPSSVVTSLSPDLQQARSQSFVATQALASFEAAHPETVGGTGPAALNAEHRELQLNQEAAANAYLALETAVSQARVGQVTDAGRFTATVVDPASAQSQLRSQLLRVGFAGAAGLLIGLALVVVIEYLTSPRRVQSAAQLPGDGENGRHDLDISSAIGSDAGVSGRDAGELEAVASSTRGRHKR